MQITVLNGVNLDVLGRRDPAIYGGQSINELETRIYAWARELEISVRCRQTNEEGLFVAWIHDADEAGSAALVVTPGGWSHYSYAIHEALELLEVPFVEVHLSNIEEREEWRRHHVVGPLATHRVLGKGP